MSSSSATRVLLVDDDDDLRGLVRMALQRRAGLAVVGEAADAGEAVEKATASQPEVAVLDLGLPDLAGTEVITRLRDRVPGIRIVVFTGFDPDEVVDDARHRGAAGFAEKRRDIPYLVELVDRVAREPTRTASLRLGQHPSSAGTARRFVLERCSEWECEDAVDTALLVVSELVTNAVMHARTACTLRFEYRGSMLRVEVSDGGVGAPNVQDSGIESEHGRGLLLVSAMAKAWGVYGSAGGGKVVWAELAATFDDAPVSPRHEGQAGVGRGAAC